MDRLDAQLGHEIGTRAVIGLVLENGRPPKGRTHQETVTDLLWLRFTRRSGGGFGYRW
jgi:hypothetical protein